MDDLIRRAALRAAAKATLWVSLAACSGGVRVESASGGDNNEPETDTDEYVDEQDETPPYVAKPEQPDAGAGGGRPIADAGRPTGCGAPSPGVAELISEEIFHCCTAELAPLFEPDGGVVLDPEAKMAAITADRELRACCNAVAIWANGHWDQALELPEDEVGVCCFAAESPFGPACTPWGPPMPPRMPARLAGRLEVA